MSRMGRSGCRSPYCLLLVVAASLVLCRNAAAEDLKLVPGETIIFNFMSACYVKLLVYNVVHTWGVLANLQEPHNC